MRYKEVLCFVISIFCIYTVAYPQITKQEIDSLKKEEAYKRERFVLKLGINELAPISAVLEYKLSPNQNEAIKLIIYTNRMKKKLFKRDPMFDRFIAKEYNINLSSAQELIHSLLMSCDSNLDDSYMYTDGIYYSVFVKQTDEKEEMAICQITLLVSKVEGQTGVGETIEQILKEINYKEKEVDFKENLKPGFYFNNGSYYLKK